jgi:hypothetical protein
MSKQPEMNVDPLAQKLARFTPDGSGLDRDALIFQAGRASVRPRPIWPIAVVLLTIAQSLTLYLYLTKPTMLETPFAVAPHSVEPQPRDEISPAVPAISDDPRLWSHRRAILVGNIDDLPRIFPDDDLIAPEPVWTVGSVASITAIN